MMTGELFGAVVMVFFMVVALIVIAIDSARSAKRMPADQGGIAGWLRWYAVTTTLGTVVAIFVAYVTLVGSGFGTGGAVAGTLLFAVFFSPPAIAPWIKRPAARIVIMCWCFGCAVIGAVLAYTAIDATIGALTLSDSARQDARDAGALMGSGVTWGTYFLRSKRVKATYSP